MNEVKKLMGLDDKKIRITSIEKEKIKGNNAKIINAISTIQRIKCLIQLGLDKNMARACSYARKNYWSTSMCFPIHKAISNKRLQQKGLVFPLDHYLKVYTAI